MRGNCIIVPFMGYLVSLNLALLLLRAEGFYPGWAVSRTLYIKAASAENLAEMSDAPVRRTALEVTDFLVNHLTGAEMPHQWDEFTSVPIVDPRLEGIRLRCLQLENERPDVRVSELRNALRLLQHLQHVHHI